MFQSLISAHRIRKMAKAIIRRDINTVSSLIENGFNVDDFVGYTPEHFRETCDILKFAVECRLPPAGFEALLRAGASESSMAYHCALHKMHATEEKWKDATAVATLLSPSAFAARAQGIRLDGYTPPALGAGTNSRL